MSASEVERMLQAARLHLAQGDFAEAVSRATEAIRQEVKEPAAYLVRAEAHRRLNHPERALADLAVAIRLDPNQPGPYVIRAEILKRRNMFDQAIADATMALTFDPRNAAAFSIRAECRNAIGDREGATEDVQEMLLVDPTRPVPNLQVRVPSGDPTPAMTLDDERFWKQAGDTTTNDERAMFADGKPVDKTYRSRRLVSDEDAPEALGVASGYHTETIGRPIPRLRTKRKGPQVSPILAGLVCLGFISGGYYLVRQNWDSHETENAANRPQTQQSPSTPFANTAPAEHSPTSDQVSTIPTQSTLDEQTANLPNPILALTFDADSNDDKGKIWDNSGATYVEGRVGKGVEFSGSTFMRVSGSFPAGRKPRTLAVWLKSNRGPVEHNVHIVAYGPHEPARTFGIMEAGGQWRFFDWGGGLGTGIAVDQEWHYHVISYDGNTIRYYFDGEVVAETSRSLTTIGEPLVLGVSAPGDTHAFVGRMDELMVYDLALKASHIKLLVALGNAGRHPYRGADTVSKSSVSRDVHVDDRQFQASGSLSYGTGSTKSDPAAPNAPLAASSPQVIYLGSQPLVNLVQQNGWWSDKGELLLGGAGNGSPLERKPLVFQGTSSPHGIYIHARPSSEATVTYRLGKRFAHFQTVGVIPEMFPWQGNPRTPLVLKVVGDGRTLWQSKPLAKKGDHEPCSVSVKDIEQLTLRVECRGPENWGLAAWVEPMLSSASSPDSGR